MPTENNTGIQTRAIAQRVDNKANLEQLQRAADPAMNPTVELHRTKEEAIKEFVRQHGTINLDWYVPDLCNTSPALSEFFKTSNFELNFRTGGVFTYLDPPGGHRYQMPEGTIRPGVPQRHTTRQTGYRHNTRRETRKNSECKETSWTSRCHAQRRS